MPNRIIKESICTSDNLDKLSPGAEILFYRLMVQCDDFGIFFAAIPIIKSKCFPWRADKIKDKDLEGWLKELTEAKLIFIYEYDNRQYLKMASWEKHQQVRASKSKYPTPDIEGVKLISIDSNGNQAQSNVPVIDIRNRNRDTNIHLLSYAENIKLSEEEYDKLIKEYGEKTARDYIERLNDYILQIGVQKANSKYKSHYGTIRNWYRRDHKEAEKETAATNQSNDDFDFTGL